MDLDKAQNELEDSVYRAIAVILRDIV
jgi:hypothetical protein